MCCTLDRERLKRRTRAWTSREEKREEDMAVFHVEQPATLSEFGASSGSSPGSEESPQADAWPSIQEAEQAKSVSLDRWAHGKARSRRPETERPGVMSETRVSVRTARRLTMSWRSCSSAWRAAPRNGHSQPAVDSKANCRMASRRNADFAPLPRPSSGKARNGQLQRDGR